MQMGARILVVDDELSMRKLFVKMLSVHGFESSTASNAAEAIELLKSQNFDLMLLDARLGADSGLELLRTMLAEFSTTADFSEIVTAG